MLRAIELENFKAFGKRQRIEFAPITLIFGENSAGKSSILQSLALLKQSQQQGDANTVLVPRVEGGYVDLGSYSEMIFDHDQKRSLKLRLDFDVPQGENGGRTPLSGVEMCFGRRTSRSPIELFDWALFEPFAVKNEPTARFVPLHGKKQARKPGGLSGSVGRTSRIGECAQVVNNPDYWESVLQMIFRTRSSDTTAPSRTGDDTRTDLLEELTALHKELVASNHVISETETTISETEAQLASLSELMEEKERVHLAEINSRLERVIEKQHMCDAQLDHVRQHIQELGDGDENSHAPKTPGVILGDMETKRNEERHFALIEERQKLARERRSLESELNDKDTELRHELHSISSRVTELEARSAYLQEDHSSMTATRDVCVTRIEYLERDLERLHNTHNNSGRDNEHEDISEWKGLEALRSMSLASFVAEVTHRQMGELVHFRGLTITGRDRDFRIRGIPMSKFGGDVLTRSMIASGHMEQLLNSVCPMGPFRKPPERWYVASGQGLSDAGYVGGNVPELLFNDKKLLQEANAWLARLDIGYEIKPRRLGVKAHDLFELRLIDNRRSSGTEVAITDVGFGISQILPFIVQSLVAKDQVITIEQPEVHIHPRLQADIGEVIAEASKAPNNNQFIVETHSEHLVLRLQKLVRQGKLQPDDVAIVYVSRGEDGAQAERLRLDSEGDFIDEWPGGFFPERMRELY